MFNLVELFHKRSFFPQLSTRSEFSPENQNSGDNVISQTTETKGQLTQTTAFAKPNGVFYSEHSLRREVLDQCVFRIWLV